MINLHFLDWLRVRTPQAVGVPDASGKSRLMKMIFTLPRRADELLRLLSRMWTWPLESMLDLLCASQRQSLRSLSRPRANERKSSSYPKINDVRKFNEFIMLEEKWAWDTSRTPANVAASSSLHRRFTLVRLPLFQHRKDTVFDTR